MQRRGCSGSGAFSLWQIAPDRPVKTLDVFLIVRSVEKQKLITFI